MLSIEGGKWIIRGEESDIEGMVADCRDNCGNYVFEQDFTTHIACLAGHFDFIDEESRDKGKQAKHGMAGSDDLPCRGKDFKLSRNTNWFKYSQRVKKG